MDDTRFASESAVWDAMVSVSPPYAAQDNQPGSEQLVGKASRP